ncbi:MAG: hypothetical protein PF693_09915 [Spirochaetia bacterium]|jgi:hypothetical protein|nr:hypothetical protein [Spirochaetia bacterium]
MNEIKIIQEVESLKLAKKNLIVKTFAPVIEQLNKLGNEFPEIKALETSTEKSAKAKRFRIDFGKALTLADKKRAELKEDSLKESKAIQNVYNKIKELTADTKAEALEIELHYERLEEEKKKTLAAERILELSKYDTDGTTMDLGNMADEVWDNFVIGIKANSEAVKEAERKAESDRIEIERINNLHTERKNSILHLWNYVDLNVQEKNLGIFSESAWKTIVDQLEELDKKEKAKQAKIKAENERLRVENEKANKKMLADKKRADDKLKAEREAKLKLEKEIADKKAEDLKLEESKKSASDIEKLSIVEDHLIDQITTVKSVIAKDGIREAQICILNAIKKLK